MAVAGVALAGWVSCAGGQAVSPSGTRELAVPNQVRQQQVRARPWGASDLDQLLINTVPDARADAGLASAGRELLGRIVEPTAAIDPIAVSRALARAGYPAPARFVKVLNGGAFPEQIADTVAALSAGAPVDVTLLRRDWSDGTTLWLAGWAPRRAELDPIPLHITLDESVPIRVETEERGQLRLFVSQPNGPVHEFQISGEASRWVDVFHSPGVYRMEVVAEVHGRARVILMFAVAVDATLPPPDHMSETQLPPADPVAAEARLYALLDELRLAHGLPSVRQYDTFEPLAREHSAFMAAEGRLGHVLEGVTPGVAFHADTYAYPKARFFEDVATAHSAEAAHALVVDSPGHLRNLLCEACTHVSIGVALEPVLDRPPRLFVTWELMEFPHGVPRRMPAR